MVPFTPRKLLGPWKEGYALDLHTSSSTFLGHDEYGHPTFETIRTPVGELLYRLKYNQDRSALNELVETAVSFMKSWEPPVEVMALVPPSNTARKLQPVDVVAGELSKALPLPIVRGVKLVDTPELKSVQDYSKRLELLQDAFHVEQEQVYGKAILLFDDLYRSGATLAAMATALLNGRARTVHVLTLTKTRSSA